MAFSESIAFMLSNDAAKVLSSGNYASANFLARSFASAIAPTSANGDDAISMGEGGYHTAMHLFLIPMCDRSNASFSMRVFGARPVGRDKNTMVWLSVLLCELACVSSNQNGVPFGSASSGGGGRQVRLFSEQEYLCDRIRLTQGQIGAPGADLSLINATGTNLADPGQDAETDLPGFAVINVFGSRLLWFDFSSPEVVPVGANCFMARC